MQNQELFIKFKKYVRKLADENKIKPEEAFILLFLKMKYPCSDRQDFLEYIINGPNDGGIDAYYVADQDKTIYLLQSKYSTKPKPVKREAIGNLENLSRIFDDEDEFDNFIQIVSKKVRDKMQKVRSKIFDEDYDIIFDFITTNRISDGTKGIYKKIRINGYDEILFLFQHYLRGWTPPVGKVKLKCSEANEIKKVDSQLKMIVSLVNLNDFAEMLEKTESKGDILNANVRRYIKKGKTLPVKNMKETIKKEPEHFLLYHNGITIICSNFKKKKEIIELTNPQIVNGGQTARTILNLFRNKKENLEKAQILIKIITVKNPKLIGKITEATNTQIKIELSDLKSNHPDIYDLHLRLKDRYYFLERKKGEWDEFKDKTNFYKKYVMIPTRLFSSIVYSYFYGKPSFVRSNLQDLFKEEYLKKIYTNRNVQEYIFIIELYRLIKSFKKQYRNKVYKGYKNGSSYVGYLTFLLITLFGRYFYNKRNDRIPNKKIAIENLKNKRKKLFRILRSLLWHIYRFWKKENKRDESITLANFVKNEKLINKYLNWKKRERDRRLREFVDIVNTTY